MGALIMKTQLLFKIEKSKKFKMILIFREEKLHKLIQKKLHLSLINHEDMSQKMKKVLIVSQLIQLYYRSVLR